MSHGQGYCVLFLDKTLYSHNALRVYIQVHEWVSANLTMGITLRWTSIPSRVKGRGGWGDKHPPDGPLGSYTNIYLLPTWKITVATNNDKSKSKEVKPFTCTLQDISRTVEEHRHKLLQAQQVQGHFSIGQITTKEIMKLWPWRVKNVLGCWKKFSAKTSRTLQFIKVNKTHHFFCSIHLNM